MTDLECRIREAIAEFCPDICAQAAKDALLGVLDLHKSGSDGHKCVQVITGYPVEAWYDNGDDCPTVMEIGRGLGVLEEEPCPS